MKYGNDHGNFNDLAGKQFRRLTVVRHDHRDAKRNSHWLCRCICGTEKVIAHYNLTRLTTHSCGCLRREQLRGREWHLRHSVRPGAPFRRVIEQYKKHAQERNLCWELTDDQFRQITSAPCFYTGEAPSRIRQTASGEMYIYNGIDRLDNALGYTVENCVPCSRTINMMKKTMAYQEFVDACISVANHAGIRRIAA